MAMFDPTKTVKTAKPSKKDEKVEIVVAGLESVAAIDAVIKSLEALKASKTDEIKQGAMTSHFVAAGIAKGARPENYRGVDGDASASLEMRIRAASSKLNEDEIDLLSRFEIPMETVTATVDTFVINPEYVTDMVLMAKIEGALKKVKGIPDDLFQKQNGSSKTVVGETALDVLFAKGKAAADAKNDASFVEDLFPVLSVLAIKPKMNTDDLGVAFKAVQKMLVPEKKGATA